MTIWLWIGFLFFIFVALSLDLGVFHRDDKVISSGEALIRTGVWIMLALVFNVAVYFIYENAWFGVTPGKNGFEATGAQAALNFFTGYVIEESLSMDNIFVIALIFDYFRVPLKFQHRVLFWGVLGALVMRGVMIGAGIVLIERFDWMVYVFGLLLLYTAVKMMVEQEESVDPEHNLLIRAARKIYPVTHEFHGAKFLVTLNGIKTATPLLLTLLMVESADVLFAVDSIPAIFAVTHDPFLVFTSNIFAIMGLRSLYFTLASMLEKFRYLKMSLVFLLAFIGIKMMLTHHYAIPTQFSLAVVVGILAVGVLASISGERPHDVKSGRTLKD